MALNDKQRRFAEEYAVDCNGAQAAIRAGYSAKNAKRIAWQLLQNPEVAEHAKECQKRAAELAGITALGLARELKRIAFADITEFVEFAPGKMTLRDSSKVDGRAIAEVQETEKGQKLKLHDKLKAIDMLARMIGLYAPEKHDVNFFKSHEEALDELEG